MKIMTIVPGATTGMIAAGRGFRVLRAGSIPSYWSSTLRPRDLDLPNYWCQLGEPHPRLSTELAALVMGPSTSVTISFAGLVESTGVIGIAREVVAAPV